jgi:hypothetical protein
MTHRPVILDPYEIDDSIRQLAEQYQLPDELLAYLRRVLALYPRPAYIILDDANALLYEELSLADKFTFNIETDELVLFSSTPETFVDASIEMAMYLTGFATLLGSEEEWVVEFTVGAWKPVKNRIKRQLGIPIHVQPRGIVGLPPAGDRAPDNDPYPFRTLVSHYDLGSFQQMVVLAGREDIAVYFPPETHAKVLAVYVYMRRAMQEIAQGLGITDYELFNTRLLQTIQRLQVLFNPESLAAPGYSPVSPPSEAEDPLSRFGLSPSGPNSEQVSPRAMEDNPFEAFIEDLFADDDPNDEDQTT